MDSARFLQRFTEFRRALQRLREAAQAPDSDLTRDALIKRFEFTYELAWKTMKRYLESKDLDVRNAKDALRAALAEGLISDGNRWSSLHEFRNLTTHTYDEETADSVARFVRDEGLPLFDALEQTLLAIIGGAPA